MAERSPAEKFYLKMLIISLIVLLIATGLMMGSIYGADQLKGIVGESACKVLTMVGSFGLLGGLISFLFAAKKLADNHLS